MLLFLIWKIISVEPRYIFNLENEIGSTQFFFLTWKMIAQFLGILIQKLKQETKLLESELSSGTV